MTTLRLPNGDELTPEDRDVVEAIAKRLGTPPDEMSMIWRAQLHWPQHVEANYRQMLYSYRFQGKIPALTKEAMHAAVSMHNRCEFWLTTHTAGVLRLGIGERGVSEIMAVAEHVASLCAAAEALRLPADIPDPAEPTARNAVRPVDPAELEGEARKAMDEIAIWARESLGVDHVPLIWRSLALLPRMFVNSWRKERLVMSAGRLDERAKACIAFAVAAVRQSPYMIAYTTARLRTSLELEDDALVELVAAVMHYVSFNTISHAMLLEPRHTEMRAADFAWGWQAF